MSQLITISPSPHAHTPVTVRRLMLNVIVALLPAALLLWSWSSHRDSHFYRRLHRSRISYRAFHAWSETDHRKPLRSAHRSPACSQSPVKPPDLDCAHRLRHRNRHRQNDIWRSWLQHLQPRPRRPRLPPALIPRADDHLAAPDGKPSRLP